MNLGNSVMFEVWFIPKNREAYSPRCEYEADTLAIAREVMEELKPVMNGDIEIVRVVTNRQRITGEAE